MRCIACNRKLAEEELEFDEDPPLCILYGCSLFKEPEEGDDL
jgi:hypothetical protein